MEFVISSVCIALFIIFMICSLKQIHTYLFQNEIYEDTWRTDYSRYQRYLVIIKTIWSIITTSSNDNLYLASMCDCHRLYSDSVVCYLRQSFVQINADKDHIEIMLNISTNKNPGIREPILQCPHSFHSEERQ